jgi:hypothetical protein
VAEPSGIRRIVPDRQTNPKCRGMCKGDRPAHDGPALPGHTPDGQKVLWCPCCETALTKMAFDFVGRAPNLILDARADQQRWEDPICQYDQVVLTNLR